MRHAALEVSCFVPTLSADPETYIKTPVNARLALHFAGVEVPWFTVKDAADFQPNHFAPVGLEGARAGRGGVPWRDVLV